MRYYIETTRKDAEVVSDPLFNTAYHDEELAWAKAKELASKYEASLFVRYSSPKREYTVPVLSPKSV